MAKRPKAKSEGTNKWGVQELVSVDCSCTCICGSTTWADKTCKSCGRTLCFVCQAFRKHSCCDNMELHFWPGFMRAEIAQLVVDMKSEGEQAINKFMAKYHVQHAEQLVDELARWHALDKR